MAFLLLSAYVYDLTYIGPQYKEKSVCLWSYIHKTLLVRKGTTQGGKIWAWQKEKTIQIYSKNFKHTHCDPMGTNARTHARTHGPIFPQYSGISSHSKGRISLVQTCHIPLFKVNMTFAQFVIDYLSMVLLFDAFPDHNTNSSPTSWWGK